MRSFIFKLFVFLMVFILADESLAYYDDNAFKQAAIYLNNGMYLEAIEEYNEISLYSDNINYRALALLFIGTTYSLYLEQYDTALKQFEYIVRVYPDTPAAEDALFNSGAVCFDKGDFKRAYKIFIKYLQKYPDGMRYKSAEAWAKSAQNQISGQSTESKYFRPIFISDAKIRVLLKEGIQKVTLNSNKSIVFSDCYSGKTLYSGKDLVTIEYVQGKLLINGYRIGVESFCITSDGIKSVAGYRCRGNINIKTDNHGLLVINHLPVEEYLRGVVAKEMSYTWAKDALKAQAVASRTYALYIKEKNRDKPYDVEANTAFQVYGGIDSEKPETDSAIEATQREVISYGGKLIVAYFHSNSGGFTEDAKSVWGADIPYLKGIPDRYSANLPNGNWEYLISYDDIKNRLNSSGLNIGRIKDIRVIGKSKSGRNLKVAVISEKGETLLSGNNFRMKLGPADLKSMLCNMKQMTANVIFKGTGYGHGVGMSQWGACKMAEAGFDYRSILKYYYQGISVIKYGTK